MATTTNGVLDATTIDAFRTKLRGTLLRPGDAGYEAMRQVWNSIIDRQPALIVCCAGAADVIAAVTFARTHHTLQQLRAPVRLAAHRHRYPANQV
jgi:hypothetical protein